jgi:hypothetical protein
LASGSTTDWCCCAHISIRRNIWTWTQVFCLLSQLHFT